MIYLNSKNVGRGNKKVKALRAMRHEDWKAVLDQVEISSTQDANTNWKRDYALIFLGAALGMRRGEIVLFQRRHFKDLAKNDVIYCPTLKQSEKIKYACRGQLHDGRDCGRICNVKATAAGQEHTCYRCGTVGTVPTPSRTLSTGVVEVEIDIVEPETVDFIFDYLDDQMRPEQDWLFEGWKGKHICEGTANRIFNTFLVRAGLDPNISYHSLRHQRGVKLYSLSHDLVLVKNGLRHKGTGTAQVYAGMDDEMKDRYRKELSKKNAFDPIKKRKRAVI